MTSSNGNIFRVTGQLCGEFTSLRWIPRTRPVTRSFDVFFDLRLNERLSKQSWGWWLETSSRPLWRHSNVDVLPLWCFFCDGVTVVVASVAHNECKNTISLFSHNILHHWNSKVFLRVHHFKLSVPFFNFKHVRVFIWYYTEFDRTSGKLCQLKLINNVLQPETILRNNHKLTVC